MKYFDTVQNKIFRYIHENNLIYNTCWEDPRCDRKLLEINDDSNIVMLTSAGCNALDYLLDQPNSIDCVDMNPKQNALLELKKASISELDYDTHFGLFGKGYHPDFRNVYSKIRQVMPAYSQEIWDQQQQQFSGKLGRKTFYYYGTSGVIAWLLRTYLKARHLLYREISQLHQAETLAQQCEIYEKVESKLLNQLTHFIVNRHLTMCMIGVPKSQQLLFKNEYERGITGFLQRCLRHVYCTLPIKDNYFWQLYFKGYYTPNCAPRYLEQTFFKYLKQNVCKVVAHTDTLSGFLEKKPKAYSHYVLLDHQDWLAENDTVALEEEWRLILANSKNGTRILLRSAAESLHFLPSFVNDAVDFLPSEALSDIHAQDRVGTYASVHLGIVK